MARTEYKFEKYILSQFPIYLSRQSGREVLIKPHYHPAAEIIRIEQGRLKLLIGTTYRECEAGELIFMPPFVAHEGISLTQDAAIVATVFEMQLIEMPGVLVNFSELFGGIKNGQYVISPKDACHAEMNAHYEAILNAYGTFSAVNRINIASNLLSIMGILMNRFSLEANIHDKNYRKLRPVLDYIGAHYADKIAISELGELIHVCDDHLIRLFKNVTGETPTQYIMNLRIESAIKLLSVGEMSVAEIAERTGFGSDTYMVRVFRQRLNTTPSKYKSH